MNSILSLINAGLNYLTSSGNDSTPQTPTSRIRQTRQSSHNITPTLSYADICVARAMLKSLGLPTELVLEILGYAQYDPVIDFVGGRRGTVASAVMGSAESARVCLPAEILSVNTIRRISGPHVSLKVKEIEFEFNSKDQGWTSENTQGTYQTSSWLEVSILRPGPAFSTLDSLTSLTHEYHNPQELHDKLVPEGHKLVLERPLTTLVGPQGGEPPIVWYLQGNKVTERQHCNYRVVWAPDYSEGNEGAGNGEGFFDVLSEGDSLLVWARAKYLGWRCEVESIKMTVRYGFDEPS